jgi:hypothetical protein
MAFYTPLVCLSLVQFACDWWPPGYNLYATGGHSGTIYTPLVCLSLVLYPSGRQSHSNSTRVAASCTQIVPLWPPVACKFQPIFFMLLATGSHACTICMRLAATRVQFICDWPPVACKLCKRWRPVACRVASFFARTLRELFELKIEDIIKKSENLRDTCAC